MLGCFSSTTKTSRSPRAKSTTVAALGAVLALQTGFAASFVWKSELLGDLAIGLPLAALVGALAGAVLVVALAGLRGGALTLGEDAAEAMGVRLGQQRMVLIAGTACVVGAATAVAGTIGFVGLVVPHILRPLVGARPSRLLWASALGGAVMLLAADLAARLILPDRDLKLGVLTAIVGAPVFLHLIYRTRRNGQ
jgi:iron complex transport system permease protein